jgi:hypothetical protein
MEHLSLIVAFVCFFLIFGTAAARNDFFLWFRVVFSAIGMVDIACIALHILPP